MGRPSVQAKRKEEILDAFEICVARFGIDGATLERIAEQSGLARPLIRHHAGNRDDLVTALFQRFEKRSASEAAKLIEGLPSENSSSALLDRMFDTTGDQTSVLLAESFIAFSATDPDISQAMSDWVEAYTDMIATILQQEHPKASATAIRIVATGILGIHFNLSSLAPFLSLEKLSPDSKAAAQLLVETLA